jgi:hypothetical protein
MAVRCGGDCAIEELDQWLAYRAQYEEVHMQGLGGN